VRLIDQRCVTCRTERKGKPGRKAGAQNHRPKEHALQGSGIAELPESNSGFCYYAYSSEVKKGTTMKSKQLAKVNGRVIRMALASALAFGTSAVGVNSYAAGSASTSLAVTATVSANCTISTSAVAFGAYDPIVTNASTPRDADGAVTVTCTKDAATTVTLGDGGNVSGGVRRMTDGTQFLSYTLYSNSGRTVAWGNTPGTNDVAHTGTGTATTLSVYGRIAGAQNVRAGSYSDSVVATVNF
jgi:spore coat protein U-like protein